MTKKEQNELLNIIDEESDNILAIKGYDEMTFNAFERIKKYVKGISQKGQK